MKFKAGQIVRIQPNSNESFRNLYSAQVHNCVTWESRNLVDFPLGTLFIIEENLYDTYSLPLRPLCKNYSTAEQCNLIEPNHLVLVPKPLLRRHNET